MKVGPYGDECLNCILERKQRELKGPEHKIFWGYGGPGLFDPKRVQCFARESIKKQGFIQLLMHKTYSNPKPDQVNASLSKREYSVDGKEWQCIPPGIVTDSSYALVLDEIEPVHMKLDRHEFKIGAGPKKEHNAAKYGGRDRFDKVCLVATEPNYDGPDMPKLIVEYRARLKCPYAVFLR
jgi:hypothetical protein